MIASGWIDDRMAQELKTLAQNVERLEKVVQADQRHLRVVQSAEPFIRIGGSGKRVVAIYTPEHGLVVASELA